jgi:hypothetical protein
MDSLAGIDSAAAPDPTPTSDRPPIADATAESRQRLAQLIGRLLARHWLRDRVRNGSDRHDPDGAEQDRLASGSW